jgi:RNA polymerase sigma factor (sigma-70 family)
MRSDPDDRQDSAPLKGIEPASDASLLRRYQGGEADAATEIYRRYAERLLAVAKVRCGPDLAARLDAEDIVQSVFGSFFRAAGQGYYEVPSGEELWKLFVVITLNKIRSKGTYHRAVKRDVGATVELEGLENTPIEQGGEDTAARALLQVTMDEAMQRLSAAHRQAVTLRIEGYGLEEIARSTGRSKRTVERLLQEARKKLAFLLEDR